MVTCIKAQNSASLTAGRKISPWIILLLVVCAFTFMATPAGAGLIAGYNETANYDGGTLWPYSIGWLWNAPTDFSLTRIDTKFWVGSQRVTIAVYDNVPEFGGTLLGSAEYDEVDGRWGGADLGSIPMVAGQDYFISFWNVSGLGANSAGYYGQLFSKDGYIHYDSDSSPPPSFVNSFFGQSNTIIRIYGDIPEPATICLLGLGALSLIRRKK
jgi:hypothetical protein